MMKMKKHLKKICAGILASSLLTTSPLFTGLSLAEETAKRIVSIGGSVTEIIYALGEQDRLIARDSTSLFPEPATKLPDVGYIRRLSPEGVLSVDPDLILTLEGAGPPEAVQVLKTAKVKFSSIPETYDADGITGKIEAVGKALQTPQKAHALAEKVTAQLNDLNALTASIATKKKVLFVLSTNSGKILVSGANTAASGIIELAGGTNAINDFTGYKTLSDEAIITAAPEVILMMNRLGNHSSNENAVFKHPAIALTPAAKTKSVIKMDGLYLLGFGPRTAAAAGDLAKALYGAALKAQ